MSTALQLTPREAREYSIARGVLEAANAVLQNREPSGLEFEITQDLKRGMPDYKGGLIVPTSTRAGLDTATSTKGAELKFQQPLPWLDMLRIESVVMRAGATFIDNLTGGPVAFPRLTTQTAPVWAAQNPLADQAQNDPVFSQPTANPKSLMANTYYSRQLLRQSEVGGGINSVDKIVAIDIARAHAVLVDGVAVGGTGASNQPTGVATQLAGAALIAAGTNGAQLTWANYVDIEAAAAAANSSFADTDDSDDAVKVVNAWVTTPAIRQRARKTDRSGATSGWMIMGDENRTKLMGSPVYVSASVPSTLTKGTSVGTCHAVVYGRWSDLYVCQWGPGVELVVDPMTLKKQGVIAVASYHMVDIVVARVGSFSGCLDALP
jgi:HK97 family phage major capsid protein